MHGAGRSEASTTTGAAAAAWCEAYAERLLSVQHLSVPRWKGAGLGCPRSKQGVAGKLGGSARRPEEEG
jgi:hypothetical protein